MDALGHTVRLAPDRTGHVGAVTIIVVDVTTADRVVGVMGAATELSMADADAGVEDVGVYTCAVIVPVVAVAQRQILLVNAVYTPGGRRLVACEVPQLVSLDDLDVGIASQGLEAI